MNSEKINIDLSLVRNHGSDLYVATDDDLGVVVCEERPNDPVAAYGGYVTPKGDSEDVYVTRETEELDVELVVPGGDGAGEVVETIFAAEVGPNEVPLEVLNDYGFVTLELVN